MFLTNPTSQWPLPCQVIRQREALWLSFPRCSRLLNGWVLPSQGKTATWRRLGTNHWWLSWIDLRAGTWGSPDGKVNWGHIHKRSPVPSPIILPKTKWRIMSSPALNSFQECKQTSRDQRDSGLSQERTRRWYNSYFIPKASRMHKLHPPFPSLGCHLRGRSREGVNT